MTLEQKLCKTPWCHEQQLCKTLRSSRRTRTEVYRAEEARPREPSGSPKRAQVGHGRPQVGGWPRSPQVSNSSRSTTDNPRSHTAGPDRRVLQVRHCRLQVGCCSGRARLAPGRPQIPQATARSLEEALRRPHISRARPLGDPRSFRGDTHGTTGDSQRLEPESGTPLGLLAKPWCAGCPQPFWLKYIAQRLSAQVAVSSGCGASASTGASQLGVESTNTSASQHG